MQWQEPTLWWTKSTESMSRYLYIPPNYPYVRHRANKGKYISLSLDLDLYLSLLNRGKVEVSQGRHGAEGGEADVD